MGVLSEEKLDELGSLRVALSRAKGEMKEGSTQFVLTTIAVTQLDAVTELLRGIYWGYQEFWEKRGGEDD